jgi:predicted nucleic acid-binding protein
LNAYADTSFLVSLYGRDPLSPAALDEVQTHKPILVLTPFVEVEFTNATELRVFHKEWTPPEARAVLEEFVQDLSSGILKTQPLPAEVFGLARRLSRRHTAKVGTRSLDLIHVASAILLRPDVFYSFDERQRKIAATEGLTVRPQLIQLQATTHRH